MLGWRWFFVDFMGMGMGMSVVVVDSVGSGVDKEGGGRVLRGAGG